MLFFYRRLTLGTDFNHRIKILAVACAVTYITVVLTISLSCHPFRKNWQALPFPGKQCTVRAQNMIVSTILNVLTDAGMLAIPVPLLW